MNTFKVRAIDPCVMDMDGKATLTIGKIYEAKYCDDEVAIIDDIGDTHHFELIDDNHEYLEFVKDEPVSKGNTYAEQKESQINLTRFILATIVIDVVLVGGLYFWIGN